MVLPLTSVQQLHKSVTKEVSVAGNSGEKVIATITTIGLYGGFRNRGIGYYGRTGSNSIGSPISVQNTEKNDLCLWVVYESLNELYLEYW